MESEQQPAEVSTVQTVSSASGSQNDDSPNRKRTPASEGLQHKRFKIVKEEGAHNWGILLKADPYLDPSLQKKRTIGLQNKWTLCNLILKVH